MNNGEGEEEKPVIEKRKKTEISARATLCWRLVLLLLLFLSSALQLPAFLPELSRQQRLPALLYMLGGFLLILCVREVRSLRDSRFSGLLLPLSVLLLFLLLGPRQVWTGLSAFSNRLMTDWNQRFDAGLPVSGTEGTAVNTAFAWFFFYLVGLLIAVFYCRSRFLKGLFCLFFLLLPLLSGCSVPMAAVLLVTAFLGEWMTAGEQLSRRRVGWTAGVLLFLLFCIGIDQRNEIPSVRNFRSRTEKSLRALRYGKDTLPEGDLRQAGILQASEAHMLTVTAAQAKNLYLRGFVGGRYADGCWQPLSRSDFSTEGRSGILQWLQIQGFSVLKAPAEYWSLCGENEAPPENKLEIRVDRASRAYLYLPATVSLLDEQHLHRVLDTRFSAQNLLGEQHYTLRERSENRPSELLTAADWLTAPQTEEQQQYCAAEAEYRSLVHELYTETDPALTELLQQYFWTDYDAENAGIYRAVSRVREILREHIQYTEEPTAAPADTDPIRWMMKTSKAGNSVLFAAAASEALRLQGIPTRYVEGYYASEAAFLESSDGSVSLSGKDAHAWVEIYFDGMGWLPVDVTPGYYYDAVLLQQMVNTPETVYKTAAEDGREQMDALSTAESAGPLRAAEEEESETPFGLWTQYLLGLLVLLLLLLFLILSGFFLLRGFRLYFDKRRYAGLDPADKLSFLEKRIFWQLHFLGLPATLGMGAEETDRQLTARFPSFSAGSYLRVSEILEKAVYGGIIPEAYELRTLEHFSLRLAQFSLLGMGSITSGNLTVRRIFEIMKTLT